MPTHTLTDTQMRAAVDAVTRHGSIIAAARATGIARTTLQSRLDRAAVKGLKPQPGATTKVLTESFEVDGDSAVAMRGVNEHVRTLADLVRVCQIDTEEWEVTHFVCNKWEMGYKDADTQKPGAIPLFQVKAWMKRRTALVKTIEVLRAELVADVKTAAAGLRKVKPSRAFVKSDFLFEFAPTDLHMGKFAWGEENVTDYDIRIAATLFDQALDYLLNQALQLTGGRIAKVLCLFGNDVAHLDSKKNQTTAGTQMDVDTRYIKVYRRICEVHRRAIRRLLEVAPVDAVIVPGNHDELTSFHMGELLAATFDGHKHVKVDNGPKLRKYYDYGINLFGFTHGDSERVNELPLTMAREVPDLWARCSSREWHIGHLHKKEKWNARPGFVEQGIFSDKGVRVRRLASLSAHDFWHTKHAYMDRRTAEAFVFHKDAGFTSELSFNVDHFTGKALSR